MVTYRELMARYPASAAADRAQLRIAAIEEMFAEKEFKGGVFYLRLGAYDSAIIYFKGVVAEYPRSSYAPKAVMKLIDAYNKIGYVEEKREMCQYLWQYYPPGRGGGTAGLSGAVCHPLIAPRAAGSSAAHSTRSTRDI
jgi:outer membrane assembly lipoprotein YfiO